MGLFDRQRLSVRLNILIGISLLIVLTGLGVLLYELNKNQILDDTHKQIKQQVNELSKIYSVLIENNQIKVNEALVLASELFSSLGEIREDPTNTIVIQAINQETGDRKNIRTNIWYQNDTVLQYSNYFVDQMMEISDLSAAIYQKIPDGYVVISTSKKNNKGERLVGRYIPNSSLIVETIERGLTYRGEAFGYLTAYKPLFVDGDLKGILYVGIEQLNVKALRELFHINKIDNFAFPYLISDEGQYIIHDTKEGQNIGQTKFFKSLKKSSQKLINSKVDTFRHRISSEELNTTSELLQLDETKSQINTLKKEKDIWYCEFYKYDRKTGNFLCVTLNENQLTAKIKPFRNNILIAGLITILLMIVLVTIIVSPLTKQVNELVKKVAEMADGKLVHFIKKTDGHEIGQIARSINTLIDGLWHYNEFSNEIGKGNLDVSFKPLSEKDTLGNSLLMMRNNLKKSEEERLLRQKEDEEQKWETEGLSMFNEILRQHSQDLKKLSYSIISNLIKYLDANQGGLFLLNQEENAPKELELLASYAYNRERNLKKTVPAEVGLLGRCVIEKKTLYFTEIPNDYIKITSGLGGKNPEFLIIVPLKDNEEVLGVIEIASFEKFSQIKHKFIEKVSVSISKTIATAKINARTSLLLKQSKQFSEELAAQEEEMRQNLEELQATQEASARRETELTGLLNALHTSNLVIEFDMEGNILNINDSFLALMRIQREQLIGKNQDILVDESEIPEYHRIRERLNAGETVRKTANFKYLKMDLWLSETYTPILDEEGIPYKFIDIAIDITENVQQEHIIKTQSDEIKNNRNLLQQHQKKMQKVQKETQKKEAEKNSLIKAIYASTLIAEFDMQGNLLNMNEGLLKLFEVTKEQVVGAHHLDFSTMNESSRLYKMFWDDLKDGKTKVMEEHIKLSSGKRYWLLQTFTPIIGEGNRPYKVLNIVTDITSKKQLNV